MSEPKRNLLRYKFIMTDYQELIPVSIHVKKRGMPTGTGEVDRYPCDKYSYEVRSNSGVLVICSHDGGFSFKVYAPSRWLEVSLHYTKTNEVHEVTDIDRLVYVDQETIDNWKPREKKTWTV